MTRPRDGSSLGWDALAPGPDRDPLAVTAAVPDPALGWDALTPASGRDALSLSDALSASPVPPSADALAAGYVLDALAARDPATDDPTAAPALRDTVGDALTAYGDATAAGPVGARPAAGRRTPRSGPVPPAGAGTDRPPDDTAGRSGAAGAAPTGQPPAGGRRAGRPRPGARPRPGGSSSGIPRSGQPGATGAAAARRAQPGAGSTARPPGTAAAAGRRGPAWSDLRTGAQLPPGAGRPAPPVPGRVPGQVPGGRGGPARTRSPWSDRSTGPTGTVPWSGRSGWDDYFGGTSGRQPTGAEVARALLQAFRRRLRDR
jgi:translation initiation factor IF-2